MRVTVYTIAKNEEQFVSTWAASCAEADYRLILDTGSSDNTRLTAIDAGVTVHRKVFHPWRFDTARNHALNLIPDNIDLCIALDMDEILLPGWRQALETMPAGVTRPRYKYVWSWNSNGAEGLVYGGDKIHARHGYTWRHPVHEILQPVDILEQQHWVDRLEIHHHPDPTKSRAQYFDLLKLAVEEDPDDLRNQFYLGREYFFNGMNDNAFCHLLTVAENQSWAAEAAAAARMLYKISQDPKYLFMALMKDPRRRETHVMLAWHYHHCSDWASCRQWALSALDIMDKPLDYLCEAGAWGWEPWDLAGIACWNLGLYQDAHKYGSMALCLNPEDQRLRANMEFYESRRN